MKSVQKSTVGFLTASVVVLTFASSALALDATVGAEAGAAVRGQGVSVTADAKIEARMTKAKERADQEIQRRIKKLTDLSTRVRTMTRVSAATQADIAADVQGEISALTALNTKIQGDPDFDVLRADIKSIKDSYRIFLLIVPQIHITIAGDKLMTVVGSLTTLASKLKSRIDTAGAAGKDVTAMTASYTDMNAKIADTNAQAIAAVSLVASLTSDNGDKAKQQQNEQALKDARAKIKAGLKNIEAARADARVIIKALKALDVEANARLNAEVNSAGKTQ
ncbi:MAG: hypothetical protein Q8R25_02025 [bacterium]|nr:hypothetical protein [bacterium]